MASDVAAYLHRGYILGEHLRIISTADHMAAIARQLTRLGCPVERATATGALVWWDAGSTLNALMSDGRVDPMRLRPMFRDLATANLGPRRARVYGELSDLLAARGDLKSAVALEQSAPHVLSAVSADILCGYRSTHFSAQATCDALHGICRAHDEVRSAPGDDLARWLLAR